MCPNLAGMHDSAKAAQTGHVLRVLLVEDSHVLAARLREALETLEQVAVVATVDNEQDATNWVRASLIEAVSACYAALAVTDRWSSC